MVKGITKLKALVLLCLLISACSEEADKKDGQTQATPHRQSVPTEVVTARPITANTPTEKLARDNNAVNELQSDDSDRPIEVLDISERSFDGGNAIAITLSAPLDPTKKHDDYFSLTDTSGAKVDDAIVLASNNKVVYFPFVEPSREFKLTVYKGLTAKNGSQLEDDKSKTITTRAILASYNFASSGSYLPLNQHSGLPVELVNINKVNVDYFKVPQEQLVDFLSNKRAFQNKIHRYYAQQDIAHSEHIYSAGYQFDAPKNKRRTYNLPTQNIDALSSPGVYLAVMSQPSNPYEDISMTHFMVTDIGMHVRFYQNEYQVALNSLMDQKPLSGVEVTLLDSKGQHLDQFKSSPNGFGTLTNIADAQFIIAQSGESFSVVSLKGPALDLSEFTLAHRPFSKNEVFIYSARDLYRPGEEVHFNALLRNEDGQAINPIPLTATIYDPSGHKHKTFTWQSHHEGYFEQQFIVPSDGKTGTWSLNVSQHKQSLAQYTFKVEEFLPERLKITFNQGETSKLHSADETLTVKVHGEYLYGAPASGNRLSSHILINPKREPFSALPQFQFGNVIEENIKQRYAMPDVKLDAQGKAAITIKNQWSKIKSPLQVTLQSSLFESGGRAISRRHHTTVISGDTLIGIKPHFNDNPLENSKVTFDVVTTDATGKLTQRTNLDVKLVKEDRRYFWEFNQSQGWHYRWADSEFVEYSTNLDTQHTQASQITLPVEYGRYRLEILDHTTNTMSSVRFFAGEDWYSAWQTNQSSSQAARPDKVSLAWDKASYNGGDTATLSIVPPKAGEAILLIESDTLLHSERLSVPAEGLNVALEIDEKWQRHDIYASVVHLQHGDNKKRITPTRAMGLIHLPLNRESRRLSLDIESEDKIYPNQQYEVKVKVQGHGNQSARLTLAMVDVGVLSLTDFTTPDPHKYFFEPRRFQVDSHDIYQALIELNDAPNAKQRFGGDAELSRGGKKPQAEVQILSLMSELVSVDDNGYAKVVFDIPDFNGRVRLMAVAFTENKFASAEKEMTIAAPVISQLAMPRFLASGDRSTLALDLHNATEQTQVLTVALTASEPLSVSDEHAKQQVTLAANEKTSLIYPVSVEQSQGVGTIALSLDGVEGYPINREWQLGVRAAYPATIEYKNVSLTPEQSFEFNPNDYSHFNASTLEAVLSLNNRVEFNAREQMKQLLAYPYGCLEQTTSATFPWIYATDDILASLDIKNTTHKSRLDSIQHGLSRIQTKALKNGSFGLWSNTSPEEHWLTAYVGDFLTDAQAQGIALDKALYQNTMTRLSAYLNNQNGRFTNRWSQASEHYDFAYRAYAGYVLSRHNKASLAKLRDLAKHKSSDAKSQLALIHLALALKNQGDDVTSQRLFEKAKKLTRGTEYLADYGSVIRDQALIIHLLIKHDYQVDYAYELALTLANVVAQQAYLSTQERNALFLASLSLEQSKQTKWQAQLIINQATSTIAKAGAFRQKFDASELGQGLSVTNSSQERLFINLAYQGVSKNKPEVKAGDLSIERNYYNSQGDAIDVSKLKVGQLVLVALRVSAKHRSPDLLVVDLLPAGLELENQNLNHGIKLDTMEFNGKSAAVWQQETKVLHQEFRDDRYVAAIELGYQSSGYLFYVARAVTPGKYKVPAPLIENMYQADKNAQGETIDSMEIYH